MLAGPDVSNNNGTIDWPRIRLTGHELAFAIAKASQGTDFTDPYFAANWRGIRARGLIRGAYHYASPHVSGPATAAAVRAAATAEAEYFLAVLESVGGIGEGDLPPALDLEASVGLTGAQIYEWTATWVHLVGNHIGRMPLIYTGWFWKSYLSSYTSAWGCPLWLAQYGPPEIPPAWKKWTLWQCTEAAYFDGIDMPLDMSYFNGSRQELEQLCLGSRPGQREGRARRSGGEEHPRSADQAAPAPRWPGRALKRGDRGTDVLQWQRRMRERGFVHIPTDGVFGDHCAESCSWLQQYLRRPPTGQVDEGLWEATWVER